MAKNSGSWTVHTWWQWIQDHEQFTRGGNEFRIMNSSHVEAMNSGSWTVHTWWQWIQDHIQFTRGGNEFRIMNSSHVWLDFKWFHVSLYSSNVSSHNKVLNYCKQAKWSVLKSCPDLGFIWNRYAPEQGLVITNLLPINQHIDVSEIQGCTFYSKGPAIFPYQDVDMF